MKTFEKKLDRKYLLFLYKDKVNDIDKVFETFLVTAPEEITELTRSINQNCFSTALHSINRIIVALNAIGLPSLAVKLQIVEVYINFSKKCNALVFLKEFENELNQYMPVILNEYCRLKAYNNYIKIQPAKTLSI
jgi:uncharacterized membrane protein